MPTAVPLGSFRVPRHRISTCVVLFDEKGRVLLVHLNYGDRSWSLPSGMLDHGEFIEDGAIREVREETGIIATMKQVIGLYHSVEKRQLVVAFLGTIKGGKLKKRTNETTDAMFWEPDLIPEQLRGVHKQVIKDALKRKPHAKVRVL